MADLDGAAHVSPGRDQTAEFREETADENTFPLLRYFSATSLVAFIVVSVVLGLLYRQAAIGDLIEQEEAKNVAVARALRNSMWPEIQAHLGEATDMAPGSLPDSPWLDDWHARVRDSTQGLSIVKVKIYDLHGHTIFSTERAQIGEEKAGNAGFQSAAEGTVASELTWRDTFSAFESEIENVNVFSSYVPVRAVSSSEIEGVFEIYTDVTPLLAGIESTQRTVVLGVVLVLGALYLLLFLIVRRADAILSGQTRTLAVRAAELELARSEAELANRAKSAFLATMSHELRTPLNAIIGYSELIQEELTDADEVGEQPYQRVLVEDVERIGVAGRHLLGLVNNVLDVAKIDAGKMDVHQTTFDVGSLVQSVESTARPLVEGNRNEFEVQAPPGLGLMTTDALKVRQILFNLLSNAAKFTRGGHVKLVARRYRDQGRDWLRFDVSDTGPGIPSAALETIFDDFIQHEPEGPHSQGTGLGLGISRRFAEMLGGTVTVESTLGEGSTFTVRLPAEPPPSVPGAAGRTTEASGPAVLEKSRLPMPVEASPSASSLSSSPSVLVIDDDPATLDILQRHLSRTGFAPILASSGEEGLRLARLACPHLITLDLIMPGLDGWSVLEQLRADPALARVPVVIITVAPDDARLRAWENVVQLSKPLDPSVLLDTVRRYQQRPGATDD